MNKDLVMCGECNQPMELQDRLPDGKTKIDKLRYRRRRFKCRICKGTRLIFANNTEDEPIIIEP